MADTDENEETRASEQKSKTPSEARRQAGGSHTYCEAKPLAVSKLWSARFSSRLCSHQVRVLTSWEYPDRVPNTFVSILIGLPLYVFVGLELSLSAGRVVLFISVMTLLHPPVAAVGHRF